jgi:hypothetical protein
MSDGVRHCFETYDVWYVETHNHLIYLQLLDTWRQIRHHSASILFS